MNLYKIDASIKAILAQIEESEGEVSTELEQALDALEMNRIAKLQNLHYALLNLEEIS